MGDGEPEVAVEPISARSLTAQELDLLAQSREAAPTLWPLAKRGFVTEGFDPATGHPGLDVGVEPDAPVLAAGDGIVVAAGRHETYGNFILLQHDARTTSLYAHNSVNFVAEGDWVERGDVVARSGNTGRSTAPHLHFEIRQGGKPVDPNRFLSSGQ